MHQLDLNGAHCYTPFRFQLAAAFYASGPFYKGQTDAYNAVNSNQTR